MPPGLSHVRSCRLLSTTRTSLPSQMGGRGMKTVVPNVRLGLVGRRLWTSPSLRDYDASAREHDMIHLARGVVLLSDSAGGRSAVYGDV